MARNSAKRARYSAQFYRHDLLTWRREKLGLGLQETARKTNVRFQTVRRVFQGNATNKKVYPVVKLLGLDWKMVHDLELPESDFHLAVLNGNGSKPRDG